MKKHKLIHIRLLVTFLVLGFLSVQSQDIKPFKEFEKQGHDVISIAFSPDNKLLASGGMDNAINLWDVNTGVLVNTIKGHSNWVVTLGFSPDGNYVVSGSKDATAKVWDTHNGTQVAELKGHKGTISCISTSYDGKYVSTGCVDAIVRIFDYNGTLIRSLGGHKKEVYSVSFSPDGKMLASAGADNQLLIWNLADGSLLKAIPAHPELVRSVCFSPDGKYIATGSDDKTIKIWDPTTGNLIKTLKGHIKWVQSLHFSPDSKFLASGSHDNVASVWDVEKGVEVLKFKKHTNVVYDIEFSADGRYLATTDFTSKLKIWDLVSLNIRPIDALIASRSEEGKPVAKPVKTESNDLDFDPGAKGKTYLLIIGVGKYTSWPQLGNAVKDAQDVKKVLLTKYTFNAEDVTELYDQQATVDNIYAAVTKLRQKIKPNVDNLMIYFSGHGFYNPDLDEGYWIPVDAKKGKETDYLPNSTLLKYIKAMETKHTFLVADACFSGSLFSQGHRGYVDNVESVKSRWGLTSGRLEYVSDGQTGKNSPFCTYFLKFLESNNKSKVPVSEVVQYVKTAVSNNSDQTPIGNPLRGVGDEGGEFIFQLKK